MPKNKYGGSRAKKGKNQVYEQKVLEVKRKGENYAQVTKTLGNGRFMVACCDGVERMGILRGRMRKRVWINRLDVVLVESWEFEKGKCSILHKYDYEEFYELIATGSVPKSFVLEEDKENIDEYNPFDINDSDEDNIETSDDPDVKKKEWDKSSSDEDKVDIDDI